MPVYETGICIFCKQQSDRLLPETGWDPETGLPVVGFLCPYCRNYFYTYKGIKAKRTAPTDDK